MPSDSPFRILQGNSSSLRVAPRQPRPHPTSSPLPQHKRRYYSTDGRPRSYCILAPRRSSATCACAPRLSTNLLLPLHPIRFHPILPRLPFHLLRHPIHFLRHPLLPPLAISLCPSHHAPRISSPPTRGHRLALQTLRTRASAQAVRAFMPSCSEMFDVSAGLCICVIYFTSAGGTRAPTCSNLGDSGLLSLRRTCRMRATIATGVAHLSRTLWHGGRGAGGPEGARRPGHSDGTSRATWR